MSPMSENIEDPALSEGFDEPVPEEEFSETEDLSEEQPEETPVEPEQPAPEDLISIPRSVFEAHVAKSGQFDLMSQALSAKEQAEQNASRQREHQARQTETQTRQLSEHQQRQQQHYMMAVELTDRALQFPASSEERKGLMVDAEAHRAIAANEAAKHLATQSQGEIAEQIRQQIREDDYRASARQSWKQLERDLSEGGQYADYGFLLPKIAQLCQRGFHPNEAAQIVFDPYVEHAQAAQNPANQQRRNEAAQQTRIQKASLAPTGGNGPSAGGTTKARGPVDLREVSAKEFDKYTDRFWDKVLG